MALRLNHQPVPLVPPGWIVRIVNDWNSASDRWPGSVVAAIWRGDIGATRAGLGYEAHDRYVIPVPTAIIAALTMCDDRSLGNVARSPQSQVSKYVIEAQPPSLEDHAAVRAREHKHSNRCYDLLMPRV